MQYDFRDLYGSVLEDWFGVDEATIRSLLHEQYVRLPVLRDCSDPVVDIQNINDPKVELNCAPNPFSTETFLRFKTTKTERVTITAYDGSGKVIEQLLSNRLAAGEQTVRVRTAAYPRGTVVFRLQVGNQARVVTTIAV